MVGAAEAAADAAGAVLRPYFRTRLAADEKADRSPVTVADRAAEQAVRAVFAERFPEHGILGEEFGLERQTSPLRWVIDPIDGTRAFITGRPTFGTLIALLKNGEPVLGVIDQPILGERRIGVRGARTRFVGQFGGTAGCRPCAATGQAELSCADPALFDDDDVPRWKRLAGSVRRVSWGGDCYAYGLLALGQIDIIAEATMKVWDRAALVPVVEGAGGRMTDWSGQTLTEASDGRTLAVGDPALLEQAVSLLSGT